MIAVIELVGYALLITAAFLHGVELGLATVGLILLRESHAATS